MVDDKHVYYHWRGRTNWRNVNTFNIDDVILRGRTKWRNVNTFNRDDVILRGREGINNKTDNCRKWSLRFAFRTNVWP